MADNAYDDQNASDQQPLAQNVGGNDIESAVEMGAQGAQAMGGKIQNAYDEETADQKDQHEAPPPPPYCIKLMNWFPIRLFCFIGGVALITCLILDFVFNKDAFIQFFVRIYLLFFAFVILIIESPVWTCTRWAQIKVFFWFRILSRMWGRAWFYLFVTILCFGEFDNDNPAEFTIVAGFYLIVIAILSFIFSKLAATKLNRIYIYVASGSEGDEMEGKFLKKYDELVNVTNDGKLGSFQIAKLAKDAGRELSNAERHAIQTYLDESCNGHVSKEDFMKQFLRLSTEKQRFL